MLLRLYQNIVVRCRFVLVVIRLDIVFTHGMIFKFVTHQYAAQIGMTVEDDSVEVEDLALLKLCTAPNRRKGWQMNLVGAVFRTQPKYDWPVLFLYRIQVIHGFQMSWRFAFPYFLDLLFHSIYKRLDLQLLRDLRIQPIHTTDIAAIVQAEFRAIWQKISRLHCACRFNQHRMLA